MGHSDVGLEAALLAVGLRPKLPSATVGNNDVDVNNFTGSHTDLASALNQTASFVNTNGSGGMRPFVHNTVSPTAQITVDGSYPNDAALVQLLVATANFAFNADDRVVGEPYEDANTAFERIALSDFVTMAHRS